MDTTAKEILWRQFGGALDMFTNAVLNCPEDLWLARLWEEDYNPALAEFWYIGYHTLFWLDLYLSGTVEGFTPPAPFSLEELDPKGIVPSPPYTKEQLLAYIEHGRRKCQTITMQLTDEQIIRECHFPWETVSYGEVLLHNMRHVQEHGAQLNMFLGQQKGIKARWVAKTKE
ncbi:MAG: DinB family protein [Chloroflexi bacterium HGW-Chloroflexi-10]|nr:MAG: DinB family protein [Chloroflexi bacterium HGW-Chloroflexi-10]